MSKLLGAHDATDRVRQLGDAIRLFTASAEKLQKDHLGQQEKIRVRLETGRDKQRVAAAEMLARLEEDFTQEQARLNQLAQQRRARIARARDAAVNRRIQEVQEREGRRKYDLQKGSLAATRRKEADSATAQSAYETFAGALAQEQQTLAVIEQQAGVAVRGFIGFKGWLRNPPATAPDLAGDEHALLERMRSRLADAAKGVAGVKRTVLALVFSYLPVWLWAIGIVAVFAVRAHIDLTQLGIQRLTVKEAQLGAGLWIGGLLVIYVIGRQLAAGGARATANALGQARQLAASAAEKSAARFAAEQQRIAEEFKAASDALDQNWNQNLADAGSQRDETMNSVDRRADRARTRAHRQWLARNEVIEQAQVTAKQSASTANESALKQFEDGVARDRAALETRQATEWSELIANWHAAIDPAFALLNDHAAEVERQFPAWTSDMVNGWRPPQDWTHASRFAQLEVDLEKLSGGLPKDVRLALPGPAKFTVPLLVKVPASGSLLLETKGAGRDEAIATLNQTALRLLASAPPGRLSLTIIDPVELGQNFSSLMHLSDYEERLINNRIWTQSAQIDEQLARLNEHIEKVSQMYLRNEYATIAEYNEQAGRIAEKYHFLIVADFPVNFSDTAAKRLMSIAVSGARCGVYTLIHWDHRRNGPTELVPDELRANSLQLTRNDTAFTLGGQSLPGVKLVLDAPPAPELTTDLLHKVGKSSIDSNRVEVPFADVAPPAGEEWKTETTEELRVPIGRTGATKLQYLSIGKGTRQHALVAGKTGSGKSTLFHVLITNLALWSRPEQVEFYLIDFKKGVEFKCYATHRLPHARVVAIESDREFGLSVLQRLDDELKRRGDLFRKLGVQDLGGYRRAGGTEPVPRTLLLIDEFQEFFTQDDRVAQNAALLLDRIVRQGRAFGIHVILGSQTLGGAYTLARATLGQMVVRVALQCNEADAYLIMDENNPAPRLLSRPGEAIYNDAAGGIEGNSPFQIVWLPDAVRDEALARSRQLADASGTNHPGPIVFEGNAPADVAENPLLTRQLASPGPVKGGARAWLGAPNSIKGPTEAVFQRQSGNNLLVVGQREESALSIVGVSLISLASQNTRDGAKFVLIEGSAPESAPRVFFETISNAIPQSVQLVRPADLDGVMAELAAELERRSGSDHGQGEPAIFVFVHELQKFKRLRYEEDFGFGGGGEKTINPGQVLNQLICDGPAVGIHVICTCDTYNNLTRAMSRKAISEFEMRVLFQMSANDSASLIDSPKASELGLHRAVLSNGQEGFQETFRPYALPESAWITQAAAQLAALRAG